MSPSSLSFTSMLFFFNLQYRREASARFTLMQELGKYMDCFKYIAFMSRMVPAPSPVPRDYAVEYSKWTELASSLEMTQEMHEYTNQPCLSEVQNVSVTSTLDKKKATNSKKSFCLLCLS